MEDVPNSEGAVKSKFDLNKHAKKGKGKGCAC